ncbi:alpha/beta hydrolase [Novosphingobium flavum]|uniref:Alpha/beta hydrolase n=1 Tax=Novosphingobium flavum TaxID=1778672 RepID=A0A7X1FSP8_9SPHN|nr:alpha/beta hydrolase [Novosphingobium flavum]MBC2666144.1 alpha/beta hydrolase [Novosphingobium flavum]
MGRIAGAALMAIGLAALSGQAAQAQPRAAKLSAGEAVAAEAVVNGQIFSAGDDPYPPHGTTFAGGVTGLPDMTYQILPGFRPMVLDLYLPPASFKGPRPVIVFTHGGGWIGGGKRLSGAFDNFPRVLASIARRGYVVAAVAYRFSGEAPSPAAIQDVKAAIRWLRANSAKYRIDRERFGIFGGSAGGQLAGLAAASCGVAALSPPSAAVRRNATVEDPRAGTASPEAQSDCVQAGVAWYGIFDFATMPQSDVMNAYMGCRNAPCTDEQKRMPSAQSYLGPKTPPILVITGANDQTVPPSQTTNFYAAMQGKGIRSEMLVIPGVDHSFIGKTAAETQRASKTALARTIDFLDREIGDRPGQGKPPRR